MQTISREERKVKLYNVAVIGDHGVGKTHLLYRAVYGTSPFYDPTSDDLFRKLIDDDQRLCMLDLFELGSALESYPCLWDQVIRQADGFILVYSVTSQPSLKRATELARIVSVVPESAGPTSSSTLSKPILLVANKSDHAAKSERFPFQRFPFPMPPVIARSSHSRISVISHRIQHGPSNVAASCNVSHCYFSSLPDELLVMIFEYLEPIPALSLAFTCRLFYSIWYGTIRNEQLLESMKQEFLHAREEAVLVDKGATLAKELKCHFIESSAMLGINSDKVLQDMARILRGHLTQEEFSQLESPSACSHNWLWIFIAKNSGRIGRQLRLAFCFGH
ncbi:P-loop containing nucleoside triphosphate hydrolase protein [Talaromyces proteolyticus]|uniref:P-loop containing nucleoside triphosphate hydrolase protein n=1 Tax=Talaromyces proteolyticus TaxID=1131652 RepID=A0AAD4Q0F7_9EURO|nr:P-loop containing nucleoside triphosphate hydrolase protein [Talaromyces proteolyticus]KAH8697128.1 P-loop containing nucleoside triphosphate hydrolase protein [Talaromyces proteolyticus]